MNIADSIRFVANEIAQYQVTHGILGRNEMAEMCINIIEHHQLDIQPDNYDWLEGVIEQYTYELKREWRWAR